MLTRLFRLRGGTERDPTQIGEGKGFGRAPRLRPGPLAARPVSIQHGSPARQTHPGVGVGEYRGARHRPVQRPDPVLRRGRGPRLAGGISRPWRPARSRGRCLCRLAKRVWNWSTSWWATSGCWAARATWSSRSPRWKAVSWRWSGPTSRPSGCSACLSKTAPMPRPRFQPVPMERLFRAPLPAGPLGRVRPGHRA